MNDEYKINNQKLFFQHGTKLVSSSYSIDGSLSPLNETKSKSVLFSERAIQNLDQEDDDCNIIKNKFFFSWLCGLSK